jgi:hypothetical protein
MPIQVGVCPGCRLRPQRLKRPAFLFRSSLFALLAHTARLNEAAGKVRRGMEYSIRRLKPLLIFLGFCGATGSRALSKPPRIAFFRNL